MARYSPTVLPYATNYGALADAFLRGRDRRHERDRQTERDRMDRERQAELDRMRAELHEINLHRAGYRRGERPTTQAYETDVTGTVLDPERLHRQFTLTNPLTGQQQRPRDPLRDAWDQQAPRLQFTPGQEQGGSNLLASVLGAAPVGATGEPRLKALPGAFVPETGTFTDRPIYDTPPVPLHLAGGRMVERPDMSWEQVGDGLWFNEAASEAGRQRSYNELVADAERQNREAAEERQRRLLAEALGGLGHLTDGQREALAGGVPPQVVFHQPEHERPVNWSIITTNTGLARYNPVTGEIRPLVGPDGQPILPAGDGGPDGATATSRLNQFSRAVYAVSEALQRFQTAYARENLGDTPSREQLDAFLRNSFDLGLDEFYEMQRELFKLWRSGDGADPVAAEPSGGVPGTQAASDNPFRSPNPFGATGGTGAGATLANALRGTAPTNGRKTLEQRAAELKAQGVGKDEARAILQREGYLR